MLFKTFKRYLDYLYVCSRESMLLSHALDLVTILNRVITPLFVASLAESVGGKEMSDFHLPLKIAGAGLVFDTILPKLRDVMISKVRHNAQKAITLDMVDTVYRSELDELLGTPTGSCAVLTSRNYGSVGQIPPAFFSGILPAVLETLAISFTLFFRYGSVGLFPTVILSIYALVASSAEKASTELKKKNSFLMRESFGGLLYAINSYQFAHQYGNTEHELNKLNDKLTIMESSYNNVYERDELNSLLLSTISRFCISFIGIYLFLSVKPKLNDLVVLAYYMLRLNSVFSNLPTRISTLYQGLLDAELLIDFLDKKPKIEEPVASRSFHLDKVPSIEFRSVNFAYGKGKSGLSDINFFVNPGEKVVIMGATGSGKSTFLKLLQRFYDFEGQILINGVDIKTISTKDVRAYMGVVSQEAALMDNMTIFDNIRYADLSAKEVDVTRAAEFSGLEGQFLRDRFFSPIKQGGADFSGGEKQRINIARALLKRGVRIFLFDEPTSSLDQKTSQEVLNTLDQLTQAQATSLIVTHDPFVAVNADHILYLEGGKIVERGTFNHLMSVKGAFHNQVLVQCQKLGVTVSQLQPIQKQAQNPEFVDWRRARLG